MNKEQPHFLVLAQVKAILAQIKGYETHSGHIGEVQIQSTYISEWGIHGHRKQPQWTYCRSADSKYLYFGMGNSWT